MYEIGNAELQALAKVIQSGKLMRDFGGQGTWCERFEQALAAKCGVKYALTMCSGTTALISSLVGLGIGPGDEVIIPAYTFLASATAVLGAGAVPIIADIDESLTLDPADVERKISPYTKAIMPVHMMGRPCDMTAIMRVARKHKLSVVEDACQAIGGSFKNKPLGAIGQAGAFSFNYYKNISCGEGGALLTNRRNIYERALIFHDSAVTMVTRAGRTKEALFAGMKFRASDIQGAILCKQLDRLEGIIKRLRVRSAAMRAVFAGAGQSGRLTLCPDNDPAGDCGSTVCLQFPTAKDAMKFVEPYDQRQCYRPFDLEKHVYTHWEAVFNKRGSHHPALNPYNLARRKITYTIDMCQASLDILARSVNVPVPYKASIADVRDWAKKLLRKI